ncbi:MAG: hypothetical protein JOZ15_17850, partial [Acidobacteria bacterium]|nr:hypothetical protein [Acidobacteriota bacterium]
AGDAGDAGDAGAAGEVRPAAEEFPDAGLSRQELDELVAVYGGSGVETSR